MGKIAKALEKAGYEDGIDKEIEEAVLRPVDDLLIEEPTTVTRVAAADDSVTQDVPSVKVGGSANSRITPAGRWDERLFQAVNGDHHFSEIFKTLRSRILHPIDGKPVAKTIMVTSAIPKEGKSFISSNLGVSFATGVDQHSLLVDCDLRKPSLATMFGLEERENKGLVDFLRDNTSLSKIITRTAVNKLSLLPSGKVPNNPAELLSSERMKALVTELSARYEDRIIIFDSPPVMVAAETSVLARYVDGIILVVRQGKSGKGQIQKVIDSVGAGRILGIVFNDHTVNLFDKSYASGYGYYGKSDY